MKRTESENDKIRQCEGRDLNPRISSKPDLKSGAFDHSTTLAYEKEDSGKIKR